VKQVLQSYKTGDVAVADVPAPSAPEPGGVLVRTTASLVSAGTERSAMELGKKSLVGKARARPDLVQKVLQKLSRDGVVATARTVFSKLDVPNPLGYSCAGVVLDADDAPYSSGQRVACAGAKVANHAEVNAVPRNLCARIPDGVSDEEASFVTTGAIALHGVRTAQTQLGERVAVVGLGLIGMLAMQLLKAQGCRVLGVDPDESKRRLATELGCHAVAAPGPGAVEAMLSMSGGRGADAVVVCAATPSSDPIVLAGELARDRARVVAVGTVGMELPRRPYYDKELVFLQSRSYGPGRYDPVYEERGVDYPAGYVRWTEQRNMESFLEAVASGAVNVKRLISHRFPIERAEAAYELISGSTGEPFLGVVLTYEGATASERTVEVSGGAGPARERSGIAFVGAGAFATGVLVPAFAKAEGARLVSIASGRGVTARHLAEKFKFARATSDLAEQLADPAVDAVVLATRHNLHAAQAVAAFEAGKHVFVEKPLALDAASLDAVMAARERAGKLLMVGFNRRFSPLARELKGAFGRRRGPLVMQYRVNAGPLPADSWLKDPAVGGGRLVGEGCHFVDFCSYLADAPVTRVYAERAGESEDDVVVSLRFADGSVGTVHYVASGDPAYPKERVEVLGDGRVAVLDDFRSLEVAHGKRRRSSSLLQDKGHAAEAQAFVDAVRRGLPAPIPYDSLVATTRATFAALESLATGLPVNVG
jgi:polar amino acid transport system substrate-binding protein